MKISKKMMSCFIMVTLIMSMMFTGCEKSGNDSEKSDSDLGVTTKLDKNAKGEISIMVWSGDGEYYEDIGNPKSKAGSKLSNTNNVKASNVAQIYAVATKFHEVYPNIKINLWSKIGDPDQHNTASWEQEMESFKAKYGKYPDIWASTDVTNDIKKALVADLSVYKDDETYKKYNPSLMENINYYGFQGGLPSYTIPGGIWVNKALSEDHNINVPDPDWDIDEFTRFISKADETSFWGAKGTPIEILEIGTNSINKKIVEENKVELDSEEVKDLLSYMPKWAAKSIDVADGAGKLTKDIVLESNSYSWNYFTNNRTLVNFEDPWYLTAGADEEAKDSSAYIKSSDWDVYPYPSTKYNDNTIKVIMDPICIHNYAVDDDNPEWSKEEELKRDISYTFATFWTASTVAKKAIYDQKWVENGQQKSAANDSFPVVTGKDGEEQLKLWNDLPAHQVYKDKEGFQEVLKIWNEGRYWDVIDKCWTSTIKENGETKDTLFEWLNCGQETVAGAWFTDKDWSNNVKARLSGWNESINKRIGIADTQLKDALKEYYGLKEEDFK